MTYTPENNPYIPGDPYSYDLKWLVSNVKTLNNTYITAEAMQQLYELTQASQEAAQTSAEDAQASADLVKNTIITPEQFGAVGDGVADDTAAIQAAIDFGAGTCIFSDKVYRCDGSLTVPGSFVFKGWTSKATLKYTGDSLFINQTAGDILGFENITIQGVSSDSSVFIPGSKAYASYNNCYTYNAIFLYWQTVSTWQGGFYHRHFNSYFRYCKLVFDSYDQNNFLLYGCTISNVEVGITISRGEGPLAIIGGSIEWFAQYAIWSKASRSICADLIGVYVEEDPSAPVAPGFTSLNNTGYYDNGIFLDSSGSEQYTINVKGCTVALDGIYRFIYVYTPGAIICAEGNNLIARGNVTNLNHFYSLNNNCRIKCYDSIVGSFPLTLDYYVAGYPASLEGCMIFDPINKRFLSTTASFLPVTATNGATTTATAAIIQTENAKMVYFHGSINTTSATDNEVATVNSSLVPSTSRYFYGHDTSTGDPVRFGINDQGVIITAARTNIYVDGATYII